VGIDRERFRTTQPCAFFVFQCVCAKPPLLAFAPGMRAPKKSDGTAESAGTPKDTLRNIRETKEFVINVVTSELAGP